VSFDLPPESSGLAYFDLCEVADGRSPPETTRLRRSDGRCLLYPAAVHWISGEPGIGKSFIAGAAIIDVTSSGGHVLVLDYEDSAATMVSRLNALGADYSHLKAVTYFRVVGPIDEAGLAWLVSLVESGEIQLAIVDSASESLAAEGYDENSAGEVTRWVSRLPRALAQAGASVTVLDHVVKAKDGGGRWARGSGAKLAAVDGAAYVLEANIPFSRQSSGTAHLRVAKDRHGSVGGAGELAAVVRFKVSHGSIHAVSFDAVTTPVDAP
jgi:AAA domain